MEDSEVITAFLESATAAAFGPTLHTERGMLKVEGWWVLAYRITERTLLVRDEEGPTGPQPAFDLATALRAAGLTAVGADLPAISAVTYVNLDLGFAPWMLWSTDVATGEADLNDKATEESFLEGGTGSSAPPTEGSGTEQARGARRLAGEEAAVMLTIGVSPDRVAALRDGLDDCRVEARRPEEIEPAGCGALLPTIVMVDATVPAGVAYVASLHTSGAVTGPIVALTPVGEMCAGADATLNADDPPEAWLDLLRGLLL